MRNFHSGHTPTCQHQAPHVSCSRPTLVDPPGAGKLWRLLHSYHKSNFRSVQPPSLVPRLRSGTFVWRLFMTMISTSDRYKCIYKIHRYQHRHKLRHKRHVELVHNYSLFASCNMQRDAAVVALVQTQIALLRIILYILYIRCGGYITNVCSVSNAIRIFLI